jgi:hypothetical protein
MNVLSVKEFPSGIKPFAIPPRTGCGHCRGRAHTNVDVPVGAGTVQVEIPCLRYDAILNWPLCAFPVTGVKFDFARDLVEANYAPRRRNPRIRPIVFYIIRYELATCLHVVQWSSSGGDTLIAISHLISILLGRPSND